MEHNKTLGIIFELSGKDYNDYGRYEQCLNTEGLTYFLITIPKFWSIPISLGLCLPDVCRIDDLEDFKMSIVDSVNAAVPIAFRGIKGIHEGKIMKPKHLKFIQP